MRPEPSGHCSAAPFLGALEAAPAAYQALQSIGAHKAALVAHRSSFGPESYWLGFSHDRQGANGLTCLTFLARSDNGGSLFELQ